MVAAVFTILNQKKALYHVNEGITVCPVQDEQQGVSLAKELLYGLVDKKTVLYLSGGSTPKKLYQALAHEGRLRPGAVGQVDERFGEPYHANSNQKMMRETGLLRYFELRDIPFYPMLKSPQLRSVLHERSQPPLHKGGAEGGGFMGRQSTAQAYDEKLRALQATFQQHVAILGIGEDGHTAGVPAGNLELKTKNRELYTTYDLVTEYNDEGGRYGERVTMTFLGLAMLDVLLVLVFGPAKQHALELMFQHGSEEEIPARFYKRHDIASKTILITDQAVC